MVPYILLNLLLWLDKPCHAQSWDWVRASETTGFNFYSSWRDSAANIFTCHPTYNDNNIIRHSKGFSDTLPKLDYINNKFLLIKSNRRGIVLWKSTCNGEIVDMDFYGGYVYVLSRFHYSQQIQFTFGASSISNMNEKKDKDFSQFYTYYILKYTHAGQPLEAAKVMQLTNRSKVNNFFVAGENRVLFYIQNQSPAGNGSLSQMVFRNTTINKDNSSNNFTFLVSLDMHKDLNWIKCCGYTDYSLTENGANRLLYANGSITTLEYDSLRIVNRMYFRKRSMQGDIVSELPVYVKRSNWLVGLKTDLHGHIYCYGNFTDSMSFRNRILYGKNKNGNSYFLKLDGNFNVLAHWIQESPSSNMQNFCVDSKDNVYMAMIFYDSLRIGSKMIYGKAKGTLFFGSFVLKFQPDLSNAEVIELKSSSMNTHYDVWLDRFDNLYTSGGMESVQTIQVNVDDMKIDPGLNGYCSFQAKLNPQKLRLKYNSLYCRGDSLIADADTIYKWFKWQVDDSIVLYGQAVKGNFTEGWHHTRLFGFESDSVMSLRIDSFLVMLPPKAALNLNHYKVCRYAGTLFTDKSILNITSGKTVHAYIWFGDQSDTSVQFEVNDKPRLNLEHTYHDTGRFSIHYIIEYSGCRDTQLLDKVLSVIESPRPGFSAFPLSGCAPLTVNFKDTVTVNVRQKDYFFSDFATWKNIDISQPSFLHTFTKPGVYNVVQSLAGFTGCITRTDSVLIHVSKGLGIEDSLHVFNSTVSGSRALVNWKSMDGAHTYELLRDGQFVTLLTDTFFHDTGVYLRDAEYSIRGFDSCGNPCSSGRVGKPILLKGNIIGFNHGAKLEYSSYYQWTSGKLLYRLQKLSPDKQWKTLRQSSDTSYFDDRGFFEEGKTGATYRVEACAISNPGLLTHSNLVFIPYIPVIYLPNAFSPNDDGVNDLYQPKVYGIETYRLTVVNRWGEIIFKGELNQAWQAGNIPEGVYTVLINYTTNEGQSASQRILVTLLK